MKCIKTTISRKYILISAIVLAVVFNLAPSRTLSEELSHEDKIISGFVYNLSKVVTWPEDVGDELVLVVIGDDGPTSAMMGINGKKSGGKTLKVVRHKTATQLIDCDLMYISPTSTANLDSLILDIGSSPILTISTAEEFCERGGIIGMIRKRGKIRLRVNNRKALAAGLILSSRLLKIVTVVDK